MRPKIFKKSRLNTFLLSFLLLIFAGLLIYIRFVPIHNLRRAFTQNEVVISNLKSEQKDKHELLAQINSYREGLQGLNLLLQARKNVSMGTDQDNPYLVFDFRQVLNDLRQLLPQDARATKLQINNKGLITLPIESVDYASLGRVLKSFKDKSQLLQISSNGKNSPKAFTEVKIPSGVQRTIQQVGSGKLKGVKNTYSFVIQAQLNPVFWQNPMPYSDIDSSAYFAEAIRELTLKGAIEGYSDGTFKPLEPIKRAEFFKVALFQFLSTQVISIDQYKQYTDLSQNDWHYRYMQLASQMGVAESDAVGLFHPEQTLTRIEALASVLTIFKVKSESLDLQAPFITLPFVDLNQEDKNLPLILTAYKKGLLEHMTQEFQPNLPVTRSEIAYWVWKLQSD